MPSSAILLYYLAEMGGNEPLCHQVPSRSIQQVRDVFPTDLKNNK